MSLFDNVMLIESMRDNRIVPPRKENKMNWIDINKHKPFPGNRILISLKDEKNVYEALHTGSNFTVPALNNMIFSFDEVEAWMPMPDPYAKEEIK